MKLSEELWSFAKVSLKFVIILVVLFAIFRFAMTHDERPMSGDDEEHLAQVIVDSIQEAEKYLEEEGPLGPEAFLVLDRADLAAEKLNARLLWLRAELDATIAGLELTRNILGRNFASG